MGQIRLDKFLAQTLSMTRSEVKKVLKKGLVTVDGEVQKAPERKVDPETEAVIYQGTRLANRPETVWLMFHKPAGCVTATEDRSTRTVMDFIAHPRRAELFPVGRLDRDTEGLLFLTNDGETAHRMLSPRHHVEKTYFVRAQGRLTREDAEAFEGGLDIGDEKKTLPAKLRIIRAGYPEQEDIPSRNVSEAEVTLCEGRFHQVKRMFAARGLTVTYLKRIRMAGIALDESLAPGEFRELTDEERERMLAECWNGQKQ